ncbi:helix-turn-helix domain-containing protein [Cetobacterium sp.]|uniref:helix-turn-helix domain-containing protein n=1 Tax=Cetobacterium sp. TaxID=2071632 RepID=UPI003F396FDA
MEKKIKQSDLSLKMRVSQKKISNIENSVQKICLEELILICFFLDLNFSQIILEYERDYILENIDKMK